MDFVGADGGEAVDGGDESADDGGVGFGFDSYDLSLCVHVVFSELVAEEDDDDCGDDHVGGGAVDADGEGAEEREEVGEEAAHGIADCLIELSQVFGESVHDSADGDAAVELVDAGVEEGLDDFFVYFFALFEA